MHSVFNGFDSTFQLKKTPYLIYKLIIMLTIMLFGLGFLCFWLLYVSINYFDNI